MSTPTAALALGIAAFIVQPALALAQERPLPPPGATGHDHRLGHTTAYRYGFDRGWREGSESGHQDGRHGRVISDRPRGEGRGYGPWMGARGDYAAGYREGYVAGYRRAYMAAKPGRSQRPPVPPEDRALYRRPQ